MLNSYEPKAENVRGSLIVLSVATEPNVRLLSGSHDTGSEMANDNN